MNFQVLLATLVVMANRKWLSDREQAAWSQLMAAYSLLDTALDQQLQQDSEISHATFVILTVLSQAPDRQLHMSDLAALCSSSQSRLSHAVARLEEAGWVARSRCPINKRQVHAQLTEAGFAVVKAAAPGHVRQVRRLVFNRLSPAQVEQLAEITGVLLDGLAEAGFASPLAAAEPMTAGG
jgi:DNA-binding MarR family transcriptional regulator